MKRIRPQMVCIYLVSLLCFVLVPQRLLAQGKKVLEETAQAMGGLDALRGIQNITREGTTMRQALGQGLVTTERLLAGQPVPGSQFIDFSVPRHVSISGRGKPTQVADWKKGGYNDVQGGLALRVLEPMPLEEAKKEWDRDIAKFVVHALGDKSKIGAASEATLDGKPHQIVSVRYIDGVNYKVFTDKSTHLISKLEFTENRDPYGDMLRERVFSDYKEVGNLKLPFSVVGSETISGEKLVTLKQAFSKISVNGPVPEEMFAVPADLPGGPERAPTLAHAESIPVKVTKLADGVYFGEGIQMNNMWVEFKDFVLVAEGPNHERQSLEAIRQIRKTVPNKPIKYLVTTHHHSDHTGGIRTYVGEGAILVTDANNEKPMLEMLTLPHTLEPDLLAKSKKKPQIETVGDRRTITDGSRTVELMHIPNPHASGYLGIYLPKEKILFESDMFQMLLGQKSPRLSPESKAAYDAIIKAGWEVDQIVPGHGRLVKWQEWADAIKAAK